MWLQWIQIRPSHRERPSSNRCLQPHGFGPIGGDDQPVGEPVADERSGEAVQRQPPAGELLLLGWGEGRDHEAVTDIHTELVPGAAARCMRVEPSPQALGHDPAIGADLQSAAVIARPLMPTYTNRSPSQTV